MIYNFHFEIMGKIIYFNSGFESFNQAKSKLEEISKTHCREENSAFGRISEISDGKNKTRAEYKISMKEGKIILKEK